MSWLKSLLRWFTEPSFADLEAARMAQEEAYWIKFWSRHGALSLLWKERFRLKKLAETLRIRKKKRSHVLAQLSDVTSKILLLEMEVAADVPFMVR